MSRSRRIVKGGRVAGGYHGRKCGCYVNGVFEEIPNPEGKGCTFVCNAANQKPEFR